MNILSASPEEDITKHSRISDSLSIVGITPQRGSSCMAMVHCAAKTNIRDCVTKELEEAKETIL